MSASRGLDYVATEAVIKSEYGYCPVRSIVITIPEASVAAYMDFLRQFVPAVPVVPVEPVVPESL